MYIKKVVYRIPYKTKIKHPYPTSSVKNLAKGFLEIKPKVLSKTYLYVILIILNYINRLLKL